MQDFWTVQVCTVCWQTVAYISWCLHFHSYAIGILLQPTRCNIPENLNYEIKLPSSDVPSVFSQRDGTFLGPACIN